MTTANQLLAMLNSNWDAVEREYKHFGKFDLDEVSDFLAGKPGKVIPSKFNSNYTRSSQVHQAISAIGAHLVDKNIATPETRVVYKQLWAMKCTATCKYCNKKFQYDFMMRNNGVCMKPRCLAQNMRDNL